MATIKVNADESPGPFQPEESCMEIAARMICGDPSEARTMLTMGRTQVQAIRKTLEVMRFMVDDLHFSEAVVLKNMTEVFNAR